MNKQSFEFAPIKTFGELKNFRNVRVSSDELFISVDCIPQKNIPLDRISTGGSDAIVDLMKGVTSEIVEGEQALRLQFDPFIGYTVFEEFVDHPYIDDTTDRKRIEYWPLLRATNSLWLDKVADENIPPGYEMEHYRIYSMTSYVDILGVLNKGEWVANTPFVLADREDS